MPVIRAFIVMLAALALASCGGGKNLGTIAGSESKVFTAPEYVVLGQTQYDQDWIDGNVAAGTAAFNWPLPKPRPATLNNAPPPRRIIKPQKKPGIVRRIKATLTRERPAKIETPSVVPVTPMAPPARPAPPPPRDPVDELLSPGK